MGLCLVRLLLFRLLLFVYSSFVYCHFVQSTFLLLFAVVCHTLLKFNVQFNALLTTHTSLQLSRPNYYPITKCTNIKITLCLKTSLELSLVFSFCLNTHLAGATTTPVSYWSKDTSVAACPKINCSKKSKNFDFGNCIS